MEQAPDRLFEIAAQFGLAGEVAEIEPHGAGNVNDTYLVTLIDGERRILQRLNTAIFRQPEQVMENLRLVHDHVRRQLGRRLDDRWEMPEVYVGIDGGDHVRDEEDGFWRLLGYVERARTCRTVDGEEQAREAGRALGRFHRLLSNLDPDRLHDVLPGFHITPTYLAAYDGLQDSCRPESMESFSCQAFIETRRGLAPILEQARRRGELLTRPIHGDPKVENIMFCTETGEAVALIDLDTVKPGLVHWDVGDCLRSCCNPAGEEAPELSQVRFDLDICRAVLTGYLAEAGDFLTEADRRYFFEGVQVIAFELGLRFFADWMTGDRYFKADDEEHNLRRAQVQFRLVTDLERQEADFRAMLKELAP